MKPRTIQNFKLGTFVLIGMGALIALLYFIGANQNLFGSGFLLQTTFRNVSGLRVGNNVRLAGINVGTVKGMSIENDTTVRVILSLRNDAAPFIKKNDIATLGSDGLMGNKLVAIEPGAAGAPPVVHNDMLASREGIDFDVILRTLDVTNRNVALMSEELKHIVTRVNNNKALWAVMEDGELPADIRASMKNVRKASERADQLVADVQGIVRDIGESPQGMVALMQDSSVTTGLRQALSSLQALEQRADGLGRQLEQVTGRLSSDLEVGGGPLQAALRDTSMTGGIQRSLNSIEQGTESFNQTMEALKHTFLLRGYFRKLERKQAAEAK